MATGHEELVAIATALKLKVEFSAEALAEAAAWEKSPGVDDPLLVDRTDVPFVTIDGEHSKDLDQAIFVGRDASSSGGYLVEYAIADAAYYVRPGSALFTESSTRRLLVHARRTPMLATVCLDLGVDLFGCHRRQRLGS